MRMFDTRGAVGPCMKLHERWCVVDMTIGRVAVLRNEHEVVKRALSGCTAKVRNDEWDERLFLCTTRDRYLDSPKLTSHAHPRSIVNPGPYT